MCVCGCDLGQYRRGDASAELEDQVRETVHVYRHYVLFRTYQGDGLMQVFQGREGGIEGVVWGRKKERVHDVYICWLFTSQKVFALLGQKGVRP